MLAAMPALGVFFGGFFMQQLQRNDLLRQQAYVAGQWVDADDGSTLEVTNPATGALLGSVPNMGAAETRRAIEAAQQAFGPWRNMPAKERAQIMRRWFDLLIAHQEDLAILMTLEQGKPLAEARGEILYGGSYRAWDGAGAKPARGEGSAGPGA